MAEEAGEGASTHVVRSFWVGLSHGTQHRTGQAVSAQEHSLRSKQTFQGKQESPVVKAAGSSLRTELELLGLLAVLVEAPFA